MSRASAPSDLKVPRRPGRAHRVPGRRFHDTLPPFSATHNHIARRRSSPRRPVPPRPLRRSDGALAAACYGGAHIDGAQLPRLPLPAGVRYVRHSTPLSSAPHLVPRELSSFFFF